MLNEERYQAEISRDGEIRNRKATQARMRRNKRRGLEFEEEMFERSSRYLVLLLTLNYRKSYREDVSFLTIQRHRDRFIRNMETSPLLRQIRGCIWHLEEGDRGGGLHLHFLIFYSAERKADVLVARDIGEYWAEVVTKGWGDYWNSNAHKDHFEYRWGVGLGQVNRKDEIMRGALRTFIAEYMAKCDQVPRDRGEDDKLFGIRILPRRIE
jgi:hypothetical protein